ncbi:MAG TPA: tripartite tricarboxylate transporter substrate binding protein [Xanthobacteraceae bacterium]|jgi:tripartite-type tricarboxylate transporter receptor subunit TctC|nr:tripartite tricarboxylate transporter substrate binding protein [Xanthobacteraceae bacterium]
MFDRRSFVAGAAVAAFPFRLPAFAQSSAQSWPTRPITAIVPFPPAGNVDITARLMAAPVAGALGQTLVVENRPGAGGNIGNEAVAHAAPDGYTVLFTQGGIAVNQFLYKNLKYDTARDLIPVSLLVLVPNVLVVPASSPAKTFQEFVAYAKTKTLVYSSAGNGTSSHLSGELLKRRIGIELTHVPYRGTALGVTDMIAGRVDVTIDNVSALLPHISSGALRALAVTTRERLAVLPNVPTMDEAGLKDFKSSGWTAAFLPAKTPDDIVARFSKTLADGVRRSDIRKTMEEAGNVVVGSTPEECAKFVKDESDTWGPIIKEANISIG